MFISLILKKNQMVWTCEQLIYVNTLQISVLIYLLINLSMLVAHCIISGTRSQQERKNRQWRIFWFYDGVDIWNVPISEPEISPHFGDCTNHRSVHKETYWRSSRRWKTGAKTPLFSICFHYHSCCCAVSELSAAAS